jgi:hypothetical protein
MKKSENFKTEDFSPVRKALLKGADEAVEDKTEKNL